MDVRDDNMPYAHVAIAVQGASWTNPDNIPLMVANTFLGSWDRSMGNSVHSSNKIQEAQAKHGHAISYQAFNTCYKDTGLWGVYYVADRTNIEEFWYDVRDEWLRLCSRVSDFEVDRAKNALKTNMLLQMDGTTAICEDIGRQMLCYGRRIPVHELEKRIDAVDAELVRDVCLRYIHDVDIACAAVGPTEQVVDPVVLRNDMIGVFFR